MDSGKQVAEFKSNDELMENYPIPLNSLCNCLKGASEGIRRSWRGLVFSHEAGFAVPPHREKASPIEVSTPLAPEWVRYASIKDAVTAIGCSENSIHHALRKQKENPGEVWPIKRRYFVRRATC